MAIIRVGTRGSLLALAQAQVFVDRFLAHYPGSRLRIIPVRTTGDRIRDRPLYEVGGKNLFIKELEEALHRHEVDVAIHSLKDVEWNSVSDLTMGCYLERGDARDALVSRDGSCLKELPMAASVGTVSSRRAAQVLMMRPDLKIVPMRGNVDTRLKKLENGTVDALILAAVALKRLGREDVITQTFSVEDMVPASGQGVLVVQCRSRDAALLQQLKGLNHPETEKCAMAERTFVQRLGAHCQSPIGVYAWYEGLRLGVRGFWMDGHRTHTGQLWARGPDPVTAGLNLAEQFLLEHAPDICAGHA